MKVNVLLRRDLTQPLGVAVDGVLEDTPKNRHIIELWEEKSQYYYDANYVTAELNAFEDYDPTLGALEISD